MMSKKLISALAVVGVLATSVTTAQASEHIRHRNTAIAAGVLGAALIGAAVANNNAPQQYYAPQGYPVQGAYAPAYVQPTTTYVQPATTYVQPVTTYYDAPAYYPDRVQYVQPATEVIYVREGHHHRRHYDRDYRDYRDYRGDRYYGR